MTTSWFIVPITGDGTSVFTPFAATVTSEISSHVTIIATNASGSPRFSWALIQANGNSFTNLLAIPGVFQMPIPSSALYSTLTAQQQLAVTQACSHYSIPVSPNATQTLISVISRIAQVQEPGFSVNAFFAVP